VAARTVQAARPGTSLITAETLRLAEGFIEVAPAAPANVYELSAPSVVRSRLSAAMTRSLSQFVGRDAETTQIHAAMDRARSGRGQVVALVGEPGVGKSRLTWEIAQSARGGGWLVLETGSVSAELAPPYLPLANLLREYLRIGPRAEPEEIRETVTLNLRALDESLAPLATPLLAVLDALGDDVEWAQQDAQERRRRMLDGARRLILRASQDAAVLIIIDDLQWIESETHAFLDLLVDGIPGARVLLLVNYRPEATHGWSRRSYYTQLRVDPLSGKSAVALMDALMGTQPALAAVKTLLLERTEGNPFFVEESVHTLVETGALIGEGGDYRLGCAAPSAPVPARVQSVLAARIGRLAPDDRGLLLTAAVIGKDVPLPLLQLVTDRSAEQLRESLARLQSAELLYATRLDPAAEYTFKHALTHEVAYGGLLREQQRVLHARITEAIERLAPERVAEQAEQLAHHALRGELLEKAVHYLRQAAVKAAARSALRDARTRFEQALGVVEALPENPSTLEQGFDLRLELRQVLIQLGEYRLSLERLREAEALAERLRDDRRRGQVYAFILTSLSLIGELDEALASGARALAIAGTMGDLRLRILTTTYLAQVQFFRGEYERVIELATDNLSALPADWSNDFFGSTGLVSVRDRFWLITSLAQLGRFADADGYEAEVIRLAERTHHPSTIGLAYNGATRLHLLKGDWAKACSLSEHAIAVLRTGNVIPMLPTAVSSSSWALAQLDEASAALNRLQEGEQLLERQAMKGRVAQGGWDYHQLGRASLLLGRIDEARHLAGRAVEFSPSHPGFAAHGHHLLGDIAAHPDQFDAEGAEVHYRESLALAEPRGMRPLVAHCHLGLGRLYRRTGKREQAPEHLTTAATMYREMGMTYWLEQVERMGASG
jgi:tetratricopeptide (TPR) repeat protein